MDYQLILSFFTSGLIGLTLTPLIIKFYRSQGWLDDPQKNKHIKTVHQRAVPRGGGLVIFATVLISSVLFLQLDQYLLAILGGALLLTLVGTLDDIFDLHPLPRLGAGFLAALLVVSTGIGIAYVSHPFASGVIHLDQLQFQLNLLGQAHKIWLMADLFALFFIVWNMNIVNWSKGVAGQLPGFVAISAVFIGLLSVRFIDDPTSFNTATLSFIIAGAYAGLLFWNWEPQKIMPGYGAGSLAGYFLSILAIISGAKVATTLMVLAIPTADGIFAILRRIRAGKKPWWGDRGHLHHKLMDVLGWSKQKIAVFYWSVSLLMGLLSLRLNTLGKIIAIGTAAGFVFLFMIWAKLQEQSK
ncbi:MAG: hypothetical protein GF390_04230 [Candidatus Pacebacteria bacterium]|nr:hypothetical protein [Candidatus Paceibacterota bacterium]